MYLIVRLVGPRVDMLRMDLQDWAQLYRSRVYSYWAFLDQV